MSRVIRTEDYQNAVQKLVDADAMEEAEVIYAFHGPFDLEFEGDEPEWYDE